MPVFGAAARELLKGTRVVVSQGEKRTRQWCELRRLTPKHAVDRRAKLGELERLLYDLARGLPREIGRFVGDEVPSRKDEAGQDFGAVLPHPIVQTQAREFKPTPLGHPVGGSWRLLARRGL